MERIESFAQDQLTKRFEEGFSELFAKRCEADESCLRLVADQLPSCTQRATAQILELIENPDASEELVNFRTEYWVRNCVVSKSGFPLLYEIDLASIADIGPHFSDADIEKLGVWHPSLLPVVGDTLFVDEVLGWDWQRIDKMNQVSVPPFHANMTANWLVEGQQRGVIAEIQEPGHQLDGMWIAVFARSSSVYEGSTEPALYMMRVAVERPVLIEGRWPSFANAPIFAGFARVSVGAQDATSDSSENIEPL